MLAASRTYSTSRWVRCTRGCATPESTSAVPSCACWHRETSQGGVMSAPDDPEDASSSRAAELERRLIRSAHLDVARPDAARRVLDQVLEQHARRSQRRRWTIVGGAGLAAAAALGLLIVKWDAVVLDALVP